MRASHADIEASAADWLARRDSGAWSTAEQAALEDWLSADAGHRVAYLRLQAAWSEAGRLQALGAGLRGDGVPPRGTWSAGVARTGTTSADPAVALQGHAFATRQGSRRPRRGRLAVAGAAVAACLLVLAWHAPGLLPDEESRHATGLGDVRTVALADGSQTTLASESRIDVHLSRRERRIALQQGEAYFEAARDAGRPFVVEAGDRRVVAVGTRFSVRRDGPDLRVVVTEGLVRLETEALDGTPQPATPQPAALLPAGSIALARRDGVLVRSTSLAEAARLVDWRSGLLVFRDTTLAEAVDEFNRYNRRKIVIVDAEVGDLRIGGSFRWANAEGFVRLLEQGFPVRADYGAERIVLRNP